MFNRILKKARSFARDEPGNVTLEALIFLPLIITTMAAAFSFHDVFRQKSLNTKAAYTISDALSRETEPVDEEYMDGMVDLLTFLTRSDGPYSMRVTVVRYDEGDDEYVADWSTAYGKYSPLSNSKIEQVRTQLPKLLDDERVIVVETSTDYTAPIPVADPSDQEIYNFVFARPRFAPQLVWGGDAASVGNGEETDPTETGDSDSDGGGSSSGDSGSSGGGSGSGSSGGGSGSGSSGGGSGSGSSGNNGGGNNSGGCNRYWGWGNCSWSSWKRR